MQFKLLSFLFKKICSKFYSFAQISSIFLATAVFFAGFHAQAVVVSSRNSATDETSGGLRTVYFPIKDTVVDGAGDCIGVSTYPTTLSVLDPTSTSEGVMYFQIYPTKDLATINGGSAPTSTTEVSIRVELDSNTSKPIALVPVAGIGYSTGTQEYAGFGTETSAKVFGISLPEIMVAGTQSFCDLMASENSYTADCQRLSTSTSLPLTVKIGLVRTGNTFADGASDYEVLNINVSQCPPGMNIPPVPAISTNVGDEKVELSLPTPVTTSDTQTNIKSVVVFATAFGSFPSVNAEISSSFNSSLGTGVFNLEHLTNDTQYCFSVGYVNKGGFVSTPYPGSSDTPVCAAPSKIEGFLARSTCFIATATYADEWDLRLEILRQFRDQILLQNSLGERFVKWYYDWSPNSAHWILRHPNVRPFVEVALTPLVSLAKALLHIKRHWPWYAGVLFSLLIIVFALKRFFDFKAKRRLLIATGLLGILCLPLVANADEVPSQPAKPTIQEPLTTLPPKPNEFSTDPNQVQPYIESLKAGHPLEPKKRGSVKQAAGFGIVTVSKYDVTSKEVQANSFESVYNPSGKYTLGFDFFYEKHLFRNHYAGAFGPSLRAGVVSVKGHGIFTTRQFASDDVYVRFFAVPISAGFSYRFLQGRFVQPYVQAYVVGIPMVETRSDNKPNRRALGKGFNTVAGVALSLDWVGRKNAWALYDAHGIFHYYLTVQYERLQSIASSIAFNYSGIYVGFLFEF